MAELPKPPSLSTDEQTSDGGLDDIFDDETVASFDNGGASVRQENPGAAPGSAMMDPDPTPIVASAPLSPPAASSEAPAKTAPKNRGASDETAGADSHLNDSLEEVLHHSSEQTLKVGELVEKLGVLASNVEDFQDDFQTGFVELRQVLEAVRQQAGSAPSATPSPSVALQDIQGLKYHLGAVDEQIGKLARQAKLNTTLLLVAVLLSATAAALSLLGSNSGEVDEATAAPIVQEGTAPLAPAGKDVPVVEEEAENSKEEAAGMRPGKKKRRRKRR